MARIDLADQAGNLVATIENQPGKKGSLVVYQYLGQVFGALDSEAAAQAYETMTWEIAA